MTLSTTPALDPGSTAREHFVVDCGAISSKERHWLALEVYLGHSEGVPILPRKEYHAGDYRGRANGNHGGIMSESRVPVARLARGGTLTRAARSQREAAPTAGMIPAICAGGMVMDAAAVAGRDRGRR